MIKKWQTKKTKEIVKTSWFSIFQHECDIGNGKTLKDYYIISSPNGVMVVPITSTRDVILVRQYRHSIRKTILECPAGFVSGKNELLLHAAKRELLEETGYSSNNLKILGDFYLFPSKLTTKTRIFIALDCKKISKPILDDGEAIAVVKTKFTKAVEDIKKNKIGTADSGLALLLANEYLKNIK